MSYSVDNICKYSFSAYIAIVVVLVCHWENTLLHFSYEKLLNYIHFLHIFFEQCGYFLRIRVSLWYNLPWSDEHRQIICTLWSYLLFVCNFSFMFFFSLMFCSSLDVDSGRAGKSRNSFLFLLFSSRRRRGRRRRTYTAWIFSRL